MALPKLNSDPKYKVTVPSTGKEISFRPYLVKEEKVLMMAFESGDVKQAIQAIGDTLQACIIDEIDVKKLATFDIEYLFTQIRSKSVGETATILLGCEKCETKNEYNLDISTIEVDVPQKNTSKIQLTDSVFVEMRFPQFSRVMNEIGEKTGVEDGFDTVIASIESISTEDERYEADDFSEEELREFVEQLTTDQFQKLLDFLKGVPQIKHVAKFNCIECKTENEVVLSGLRDFL